MSSFTSIHHLTVLLFGVDDVMVECRSIINSCTSLKKSTNTQSSNGSSNDAIGGDLGCTDAFSL